MKNLAKVLVVSAMILVVLPRWGESCLPEFPRVVFTRASGPDKPMAKFARGQIGIPLPSWRRAYLVVAYRYLDDKPLRAEEQHSLLEFFDVNSARAREVSDQLADTWLRERAKYAVGSDPKISPYRQVSQYSSVTNCLPPAFENAVQVLHARAGQLGPKSSELREWIKAQDAVFEDCGGGSFLPQPLPASAKPLLRADRAYQIAAAHFYAMQLQEALRDFDSISQDESSPWHLLVPYMAARTVIRQAWSETGTGTEANYNTGILLPAESRLAAILSDPKFKSQHKDAERLQALVQFHLHPDARQHELARILLAGKSGANFGQHLLDYKLLLDRFLDVDPPFQDGSSWGPTYDRRVKVWKRDQYSKLKAERSDELSDWVMTIQTEAEAAKMHAVNRWKSTGSTPWLFAALLKLKGTDEATPDILKAAAQISGDSPAYTAISFHRSRLLRESGQDEAARHLIESVLHKADSLPLSAINLLQDEQMRNTPDFDSFGAHLARYPVELSAGTDITFEESFCYYQKQLCNEEFYGVPKAERNSPPLPQFDLSAAETLNKRLPVDLVVELAASNALPANLQKRLASSAWARAALLGNVAAVQKAAGAAVQARPELKPFLDGYAAAKTDDERQFAAAFAIEHFPGLRPFVEGAYPRTTKFNKIDSYRDNWWCDDVGGIPDDLNFSKQNADNLPIVAGLDARFEATSPVFLSPEQKARAVEEWKQLLSIGVAANYLPSEVLAWARKHPEDPRVPEALHFAWRADRYGCVASGGSNLSHDIFKLLHRRYPTSEWTKKTRVW